MGVLQKTLTNIIPEWTGLLERRRHITPYNPSHQESVRKVPEHTIYTVFDYSAGYLDERRVLSETACKEFRDSGRVTWINADGLIPAEVEKLSTHYGIHALVVEDILSIGQRAKMDEIGEVIFGLLPMVYYNEDTGMVETEQVSIVLGKDFVISFQEDPERDVFNPIRERLRHNNAKIRSSNAEYLCYCLIDSIVDSYFGVIEKLSDRVEKLEDALLQQKRRVTMSHISLLRREVMLLVRSILPVRDLVNGFVRSENDLLSDNNQKYWKDVQDHIIQANDYAENLREMLVNLQDLFMSQINMRTNEVMKTFTIITVLLAPATVIGGIFGMNFDVIPLAHHQLGFYALVSLMFVIPLFMLLWFKRKGWF